MFSMKITLLGLAVVLAIDAAPQLAPTPIGPYNGFVPIVSQHYDLNPDQSYSFSYQSADGSARNEVGVPRVPGPEGPAVAVQGTYAYNSPAGPIELTYVADENGFQPSGNGVHPDIVKAVAQQVAEARGTTGYNPGGYYNAGAYNPGGYYNAGAYNPGAYYNPVAPVYNPGAYNRGPFQRY